MNDKDLYFVAVKVFLEKDGKFLIFKDGFDQWDIPGGRLKKDEFDSSLEDVVARKMSEELGNGFSYQLGQPLVMMRHQRVESSPGNPTVRIFAVGYQAILTEGEVKMSSHHTELLWVDPKDFKAEEYFTGGWLKGVQEYIQLKQVEK